MQFTKKTWFPNCVVWFSPHLVMIREEEDANFTIIRSSNGTKLGMFPAKFKFIFPYANP
jgi:hypothetical protein